MAETCGDGGRASLSGAHSECRVVLGARAHGWASPDSCRYLYTRKFSSSDVMLIAPAGERPGAWCYAGVHTLNPPCGGGRRVVGRLLLRVERTHQLEESLGQKTRGARLTEEPGSQTCGVTTGAERILRRSRACGAAIHLQSPEARAQPWSRRAGRGKGNWWRNRVQQANTRVH